MKILLIQLRQVGDVLLTTPVLSPLKQALPEAHIDFLVDPPGGSLVETHPAIDEVLIYNRERGLSEMKRVRSKRYDAIIDFMGNPRTGYITLFSGARWKVGFSHGIRSLFYTMPVAIPREPEYVPKRKWRLLAEWLKTCSAPVPEPMSFLPTVALKESDKKFSDQWIQREKIAGRPFVIIAPDSRRPIRRWRSEGFREVALRLVREMKVIVYLAWGPGEETYVGEIRKGVESEIGILPPTTLCQMGSLLQRASLLLSNDSGAMHLAVAVGTPTVTLYGPTRPIDWNPALSYAKKPSPDVILSAREVACLGCHLNRCDVGHLCMRYLTNDQVYQACKMVLQEGFK